MRESLPERDPLDSHYERRVQTPAHRRGTLPTVGVYLDGTRWRIAPLGSGAERALKRVGALLVAQVSFDGAAVPAASGGGAGTGRLDALLPWPPEEAG
jgi:hypothetical protein